MKRVAKMVFALLGVSLIVLSATAAFAQESVVEIRNGVVLARQVGVHELKPGQRFTAVISVVETPVSVTATEVQRAEVVHKSGSTVILRKEDGTRVKFTADSSQDETFVVSRDGKQVTPYDLKVGDKITATIITKGEPQMMTSTEFEVFVKNAPPPRPARRPVTRTAPPPPPPPPPAMPKTGSSWPLVGLVGGLLLALGAGLTLGRRFLF